MHVDIILQSKGMAVFTVPDDATVLDAIRELNARRIGAVVVTDSAGSVAGIVSERDVVRRLEGDPVGLLAQPVSAIMSKRVVSTTRDATISRVMELMTEHRIRHMPVIEDGVLVGILSIGDVVKSKIEEAELEATALREYIAS